jgi:hypothetical protein
MREPHRYPIHVRAPGVRGFTAASLAALALAAAAPAVLPAQTTHAAAVDALAWLAGCWEGTLANGAAYEEVWLGPRGGTLIGMARMTREDRILSFEFMRIGEHEGEIVYGAQPSGRPPTRFRATAISSGEVRFENPDHDFPQRIHYRLAAPGELHARIEGEQEGQLVGMDFPLRRVPCPEPPVGDRGRP